ncbi:auxin-responsive protein SAUR36-like [Andrographis paniculata]|uniref:auxin-responsive protein SAUR36-like n=1 Tax=Andrographis paniculata TaxID=175694 RepID=UPI0021E6E15F|nr:auxin-responsive protein SAUR36-like [Andrographis paniculata]
MGRIRGFLLKHRVFKIFRRRCRSSAAYRRLDSPLYAGAKGKPFSSLVKWSRRLRTKAKAILSSRPGSGRGYLRVGQDPGPGKPDHIPKGHMAVYVGQKDCDFQRILVPVVYFNHPLFGDLLKESEKEFGFHHPGGITIPCRISEFERIQTRIQCTAPARKRSGGWFVMP